MSTQESPQPTYDFTRAFSFNTEVYPQFLEHFLDSGDFQLTSEEVMPNPYIQAGEIPTGIRDLQFSLRVKITHTPTGTEQLLTKTEPDEPFTVVK
jgi:hypothetical protein